MEKLRRELHNGIDVPLGDFEKGLRESPAVYFYARVVLPGLLLYQTTPLQMLRQVRSARRESEQLKALEQLVRLDPLAGSLPEVQAWTNMENGEMRLARQQQVLRWQQQGPGHGKFERSRFKAMMGALMQVVASNYGRSLDGRGQWHDAPDLAAEQVRTLFHAAAKDRVTRPRGGMGGVVVGGVGGVGGDIAEANGFWPYLTHKWLRVAQDASVHHTQQVLRPWWSVVQAGYTGAQDAEPLVRRKAINHDLRRHAAQILGGVSSMAALMRQGQLIAPDESLDVPSHLAAVIDTIRQETRLDDAAFTDRVKRKQAKQCRAQVGFKESSGAPPGGSVSSRKHHKT